MNGLFSRVVLSLFRAVDENWRFLLKPVVVCIAVIVIGVGLGTYVAAGYILTDETEYYPCHDITVSVKGDTRLLSATCGPLQVLKEITSWDQLTLSSNMRLSDKALWARRINTRYRMWYGTEYRMEWEY